ncbi:MAG: hypothetical protein EBS29_03925 [Chloroflexia bacterium]|nr:hypothetical protein [Chloroflexia bacterium]
MLNGLGALLASGLILRNRNKTGWWLGIAVAASAIVGYVISRTVGLPGLEAEISVKLPLLPLALG